MTVRMIHPECLCDRHLLEEHRSLHAEAQRWLAPQGARAQHRAVADELGKRGFAHGSPFIMRVGPRGRRRAVDANASARELAGRCGQCHKRMEGEMLREATSLKRTFAARLHASPLWEDPMFKGGGARALQQITRCVVEVSWGMTHAAGRAWRASAQHNGRPLVKLSGLLLAERWEQLEETVLHELAHVFVQHAQTNAKPHGRLWKAVARAVGCRPKACHSMRPARDNTVPFACECRTWALGRTRAKRVISGMRQYSCPNCGQHLVPARGV